MKAYKASHLAFSFVLFLIFTVSKSCFGQVPPPSGPQCVTCKGMNGNHYVNCPYYNPPKTTNTNQPLKDPTNFSGQNPVIDILLQVNEQIDAAIAAEEAKEKAIQEKRQSEISKSRDSVATIKHENTKGQLKPIPSNNPPIPSTLKSKIVGCKDGYGFKVYNKGAWDEYNSCSELQSLDFKAGDTIISGFQSKILFQQGEDGGKHIVQMQENSVFGFGAEYVLDLIRGKFLITLETLKSRADARMNYRVPGGTCSIRGTTFIVNISENGQTEIILIDGEIEVETINKEEKIILKPGKKIILSPNGKIEKLEDIDSDTLRKILSEDFNN